MFDVVVVGAGAAGLQATAHLLRQRPSLSVAVLERCSSSGGRIRDVKFAEGIEVAGLGAWRIDSESKLVLDLLRRHETPMVPWAPQVRRFEAKGVCVNSIEELRSRIYQSIPIGSELADLKSHLVPGFLQRTVLKSIEESTGSPTRLRDLIRESLGEEGEQFLSAISHGYKALAEYDIDIMGTLASANAGSETTRPVGGMSKITNILESECRKGGALFQHCTLVKRIIRASDCAVDGSPVYEVTYVKSRGRILSGSDTFSDCDLDEDVTTTVIKARCVVLGIPPRAISRIADLDQDLAPTVNILRRITNDPIFRSCFGIPAFRAAALYPRAWWDDNTPGLQPLEDRGAVLTSTSRLSMILPYSGRGPNGEAVLHLSYCNDINAKSNGGFWSECTKRALHEGSQIASDPESALNRPRAVDKVMYQFIRAELAKAFTIQPEDIPDPIQLEWHYWDDGAVHVQQPVDGFSGISRKTVEDWAVSGPLISRGLDAHSGDRIVLAGEGFAEKWAWVEGSLVSATRAAETVLHLIRD